VPNKKKADVSYRPKLILHVGLPKTGTSAIQAALYGHREKLKLKGALYSNVGLWHDHSHHLIAFALHPEIRENAPVAWEEIKKELTIEANTFQGNFIIISSEVLSSLTEVSEFDDFCSFLKQNYEDVFVVFSLRNVYDYADSYYRQVVRDPGYQYPYCCGQFVVDGPLPLNWCRQLHRWSKAFGGENVVVTHYDRSAGISNTLGEITTRVGISLDEISFVEVKNQSLNNLALFMMLILNISQGNARYSDHEGDIKSILAVCEGFERQSNIGSGYKVVLFNRFWAENAVDFLGLTPIKGWEKAIHDAFGAPCFDGTDDGFLEGVPETLFDRLSELNSSAYLRMKRVISEPEWWRRLRL